MVVIKPTNLNMLAGTISNRRKSLGLSQAELAEKAGVHQETVSYIESGKRIPNLMNMVSILSALDMVLKIEMQN